MLPIKALKRGRRILAVLTAGLLLFLCGCSSDHSPQGSGKICPYSVNAAELNANRYTSCDPGQTALASLPLDGFEPVMENDRFILYYNRSLCGIRFLDKSNGYIWGSLKEEKPENLNKKWAAFAHSIVAVEVADKNDSVSSVGASAQDITYAVNGNKMAFKAAFQEYGISFAFDFILTDDGFRIEVVEDSLKEGKTGRLVSVIFLPYFGAVEGDEKPGYLFVPDGCGALIRFHAPRNYLEGFSKKIYGADYGIESMQTINDMGASRINAFATDEQQVTLPVFGIAHGTKQNAFYAVIESGDESCRINADPAGIVTDYNRVNASFLYRETYEQPVNRKSAGIKTLQKESHSLLPVISYHFLSGENADYVGMAKGTRDYLIEKKLLTAQNGRQAGEIPLRLDVLVSDVQKEFLGSSVNTVTEYADVKALVENLHKADINHISLTLLGWQKAGLSGYKILKNSAKGRYSDSECRSLSELLRKNGGDLLLYEAVFKGSKLQLDSKTQSAITMSQNIAKITAEDDSLYLADEYLLKPVLALQHAEKQITQSQYALAFGDLGNMLYGEYLENDVTPRAKTLALLTKMLARQKKDGMAFYRPNSYLYPYTERYFDAPIVSSQYVFESDCVPFLQIVLSGSMEVYSPCINCNLYSKVDLLKMIDYNVYPSFILSGKENYEFRNTASAAIQSSKITDWQDYIKDSYSMMNAVLCNTYGKPIQNRTVLANGFVRVDYADGSVFVNYGEGQMQYGGFSVEPQTAIYVSGGVEP